MTPEQLAAFETGAGFSVANLYLIVGAVIGVTLLIWGAASLLGGWGVSKGFASVLGGAGAVLAALTIAVGFL